MRASGSIGGKVHIRSVTVNPLNSDRSTRLQLLCIKFRGKPDPFNSS